MSEERNGPTPEQLAQLRAQMSLVPSDHIDTPQVSVTSQPIQSTVHPAARTSRNQALREQMMAGQQNASSSNQVVMQQGTSYQPASQTTTPVQSSTSTQPVQQATTTIINTTQQSDDNGRDDGNGFKLNKTMVFAIVGVVLFLIIALVIYSSGNKGKNKEESTTTPSAGELDPNLEWIEPEPTSYYTPDQIVNLRAAGYTGDEIENYSSTLIPYEQLIEEANALRDAYIQEAIAPLYDTASDEYKKYIAQTWLSLPERMDTSSWDSIASFYEVRRNLDYEKIPVHGNQLFIKIYLDDNDHLDWFFLCINPEEWNKLNDTGNVIVNYTYCTRYIETDLGLEEDASSVYITGAYLEIIE